MEMVDEQVITIITSGDTNGRKLSIKLEKNSIPHEVLIVSHTLPKRIRGNIFRYFKSYFGRLSFFRKIRYLGLPAYGVKESYVGLNNGRRLLRELNKKKRRFLILMGGGIISEEVISTAKEGVINVHPGKIPEIRGLDAIFHSILKEIPLTLTAHFVDKGIDTGEIIRSILIPLHVPNHAMSTNTGTFNSSASSNILIIFEWTDPVPLKGQLITTASPLDRGLSSIKSSYDQVCTSLLYGYSPLNILNRKPCSNIK